MRFLVMACALTAVVLTGCGAVVGPGGPGGPEVEGRTFLSTGVTEDGGPGELAGGSRIRLAFADGSLTASAGCNTMSGPYRLDGQTLVAQTLAMTEMGCDPALMEQDSWLADLLTSRPALAVEGDELTLTAGSTVVTLLDRAVADPDRPLVGTTWHVDSIVSGDTAASTPGGAEASVTFHEDGTVDVMPGCNQGSGTWTQGEGTVMISELVLTRMACPGPRGELEQAVLQVLQAGELEVEITAASLRLTAGDLGLGLRAG